MVLHLFGSESQGSRIPPETGRVYIKKSSNSHCSGFTLIELLVVTGIIAILAAISVPVITSSLNYAKRIKCVGNLRSIGVALHDFAADNDEQFPQTTTEDPALGAISAETGKPGWMEQLDPYDNSNHEMFICPASPSKGICNYYLSAWAAYYANGMNHPTPPVSLPRIKNLSTMILAGEFTWGTPPNDTDPDDADVANLPFGSKPWHGKYYNILFVDGHIESVTAFDKTAMTNRYEGLGYDYNSQAP